MYYCHTFPTPQGLVHLVYPPPQVTDGSVVGYGNGEVGWGEGQGDLEGKDEELVLDPKAYRKSVEEFKEGYELIHGMTL